MSRDRLPPWGAALLGGLIAGAADTLGRFVATSGAGDEIMVVVGTLDFWVSCVVFFTVGTWAARTAGVRGAAEMGFLAGLVVALVNLLTFFQMPLPSELSQTQQIVGLISQNLFLGGAIGWFAGNLGVRRDATPPKKP